MAPRLAGARPSCHDVARVTAPNIRVEHRESLAFALSEAAELEHGLLCCYLYTAFSIGPRCERRHGAEQAAAIARWRAEITDIARDEMIHLALVSNLLNAIGAAPHFMRPNFPVASGYHPAGIVVSLAPFCLSTIQHFVYLERPEDVIEREGEGFARRPYTRIGQAGRLVPSGQDYATQGDLYRWIRAGFAHLVELHGEAQVLCGDPRLQVTSAQIGLPGVTAVTDLASAERALDTIVTQGEGAPRCPGHSHFSRFSAIRRELEQVLAADPAFAPAAGVAYNPVMRPPANPEGLVWIDAEPAASVLDVANAIYAFTLRSLGVLHSPVALADEPRALALEAILAGMRGLTPIAELLTELPARRSDPTLRAGLSFTMSRSLHPLPEPRAALRVLHEGISAVAGGIRTHVAPLDDGQLATADQLDDLASRLQRAAERASAVSVAVAPAAEPAPKPVPAAPAPVAPAGTAGAPAGPGRRARDLSRRRAARTSCSGSRASAASTPGTACSARRGCSWPTCRARGCTPTRCRSRAWSTSPGAARRARSPTSGSTAAPTSRSPRSTSSGCARTARTRCGRTSSSPGTAGCCARRCAGAAPRTTSRSATARTTPPGSSPPASRRPASPRRSPGAAVAWRSARSPTARSS